jgi:hypothetical protein
VSCGWSGRVDAISITPLDTCREWVYIDGVVNVDTIKWSDTDMNDLEFIRKHVKVWPEGEETVRLDRDGEICFMSSLNSDCNDFYPVGYVGAMFNSGNNSVKRNVGRQYTRDQWLGEQNLTTLDVPFGELDRDTQLRLINHVLDGGERTRELEGEWVTSNGISGCIYFNGNAKYRAVAKQVKQPTERETLEAKLHEQRVELNATMKRITEIK